MENLASQFSNSASAVLQLGDVPASVDLLDDDAVVRAIEVTTTHQRSVDAYLRTLAASIARRSTPEMGYAGLARRRGFATPEAFIQSISGCTYAEAARLVQLGRMVANVEDASAAGLISADPADGNSPVESGEPGGPGGPGESGEPELRVDPATGELALVPVGSADDPPAADLSGEAGAFDPTAYWQVPIVEAVSAGRISASSADSLRRGLGHVDAAITARQLRETVESLLREVQASSTGMSAEQLLRRARQARGALDSRRVLDEKTALLAGTHRI